MWIRLARAGPPDWVCSPLVAISYHRQNASRDMAAMIRQLDVVAERYGIRVDRARHFRWAAWHALLEGRRADAIPPLWARGRGGRHRFAGAGGRCGLVARLRQPPGAAQGSDA